MKQYLDLLQHVMDNGSDKSDRTGTGTRSVFGFQMRFNLADGFPIVTTKKVHLKSIIHELLFFIRGDTSSDYLLDNNVTIWEEWTDTNGFLGKIYPFQWRNFNGDDDRRIQPKPLLPEGLKANIIGIAHSDHSPVRHPEIKHLFILWRGMICRCYNKVHEHYKYYGGKGVFVNNRWLVFENFLEDIKGIPNWDKKVKFPKKYELDKDIIGTGFEYSKETCLWVTKEENMREKYKFRHVLINKSGEIAIIENPKPFYTKNRISQGNFCQMLLGEREWAGGWKVIKTEKKHRGIDQISWLINEIKTNPDSRRLIVTAWNPAELDQMALPPCHCFFQFYVANGKLSCQLYQRSGDILLGIPFNIASYSLLTMMVAQVCNLELGEFIHTIGDAHAYKNHFEQIEEQLTRTPLPLPQMILNKNIDNIFDFSYSDFNLQNYQHYPAIKAPVAV